MHSYRTLCKWWLQLAVIGRDNTGWYRDAREVIRLLADHGYEGYRLVQENRYVRLCDVVAITNYRTKKEQGVIGKWRTRQ